MKYTLYMLRCSDNSLYTGITNDLDARLEKHRAGAGSKYVRSRLPFELVYTEECEDKSSALQREIEVKKMTKVQKLNLITDSSELLKLDN